MWRASRSGISACMVKECCQCVRDEGGGVCDESGAACDDEAGGVFDEAGGV
eukprot:CAMPEP_0113728834 /NCGR_PEP_ID=MMETSP0038_2-20120614/42155_1 /TAXON_ID=2898 /ORGANISM="Cryptomonas paramecium" /LENGTH=50 /DNA_ID=CAMNT_0000660491 /DNA_START=56 /DNA_END=208 /DNA_ORIENTATION=- /assembly_acc=CAM_ASM_000170